MVNRIQVLPLAYNAFSTIVLLVLTYKDASVGLPQKKVRVAKHRLEAS